MTERAEPSGPSRTLHITDALVRRYSRRGNYHSEPETADALRLPGLVAQGTQATGPAYGLLLDAWGESFLASGEIDVRFVGLTLAGESVRAALTFTADTHASVEIVNLDRDAVVVVGTARREADGQLP